MLNQLAAVGRLVEKPTLTKLEDGKEICRLTLAVPRSYKNAEGVYETDFLDIVLWNAIASNTVEYGTIINQPVVSNKPSTLLYKSVTILEAHDNPIAYLYT